jgi:hypothetical protein
MVGIHEQSHYMENILSRFRFSDYQFAPMPYDPSVLLMKNQRITWDQLIYSQIIASHMYLASATWPDIPFPMSELSRFVPNLGDDLWHALETVMRHWRGKMSYVTRYSGYPRVLEGYYDANSISDFDEMYVINGYLSSLGGGAISLKSCKHAILIRSTHSFR